MEISGVKIDFLGHSGFLIINKDGKRIAIDPYNVSSSVSGVDLILITHNHYDHCSIKDIEVMKRQGTVVIIPADAQSKITKVKGVSMEIIEVGDELEFGNVKIEALPAYNVGKDFHPKKEGWMGYLIKLGEVIIYHSGDTDKIPEMKNLTGYGKKGNDFVVLLPVSGGTVMNNEEAAQVANILSPSLAIPMHYGSGVVGTRSDAEKFCELCEEMNIRSQLLEKI